MTMVWDLIAGFGLIAAVSMAAMARVWASGLVTWAVIIADYFFTLFKIVGSDTTSITSVWAAGITWGSIAAGIIVVGTAGVMVMGAVLVVGFSNIILSCL